MAPPGEQTSPYKRVEDASAGEGGDQSFDFHAALAGLNGVISCGITPFPRRITPFPGRRHPRQSDQTPPRRRAGGVARLLGFAKAGGAFGEWRR